MLKCKQSREGDEVVCSCGYRWELGETDPHPTTPEECIAKAFQVIEENEAAKIKAHKVRLQKVSNAEKLSKRRAAEEIQERRRLRDEEKL
jgi:hypothetical protein